MPFGLYLHYPFCRNKCSYCDHYNEPYDSNLEKEFYRALKTETQLAAGQYASSDNLISSIFVGGGTPSLTSLDLFADWLTVLKRSFEIQDNVEFTIETNPESVSLEVLRGLFELGVNRPIFGIQSFNTSLLRLLDRQHQPHHCHRAVYQTNALGFSSYGVDLVFGMPGQTSKMLSADLDQLLDLEPPHVSFYRLTIEEGTPLAALVASGKLETPDRQLTLALYRGGCEKLSEKGYHRYEVRSFARPGYECRHNLSCWQGDDYLGLGPSSHSFMQERRFANIPDLAEYIATLKNGKPPPRTIDESGLEERMAEAILLGLRTDRGISRSRFSRRFGVPLENRLDPRQYDLLVESGHLITDKDSLRLSENGVYLIDDITRRLLK